MILLCRLYIAPTTWTLYTIIQFIIAISYIGYSNKSGNTVYKSFNEGEVSGEKGAE